VERQKAQEVLKEKRRMEFVKRVKKKHEEEARQQDIEAKASMDYVAASYSSVEAT
jgi:hypothetical protein